MNICNIKGYLEIWEENLWKKDNIKAKQKFSCPQWPIQDTAHYVQIFLPRTKTYGYVPLPNMPYRSLSDIGSTSPEGSILVEGRKTVEMAFVG